MLTSGRDSYYGTSGNDVILVPTGTLTAGDSLNGSSGTDTIRMLGSGTLDTTVASIDSVEVIEGSAGDDRFILGSNILGSQTWYRYLNRIDGGSGNDVIEHAGGRLDLRNLALGGVERITGSAGSRSIVQINDVSMLSLLDGTEGQISVDLGSLVIAADERQALFDRGIAAITQGNGLTYGSNGDFIRPGTPVNFAGFGNSSVGSPTFSALAGGGFIAVWSGSGTGASWSDQVIYGRLFDNAGVAIGAQFRLDSGIYVSSHRHGATVTSLTDGGFIASWTSNSQDGSYDGIFAQRFSATGQRVGVEFQVNTSTLNSQNSPTMTVLANGESVIAWYSAHQSGAYGIYFQRFAADGTRLGAETRADSGAGGSFGTAYDPQVIAHPGGGFSIIYISPDGDGQGISLQRFAADGTRSGSEIRLNALTAGDGRSPTALVLADGGMVVVWANWIQGANSTDVYMRRLDASGTLLGQEVLVNSTLSDAQFSPAIALLRNGDFVIAWSDGSSSGIIRYQRFTAAGEPIGGEMSAVSSSAYGNNAPSIVALENGGFLIGWGATYSLYSTTIGITSIQVATVGTDTPTGTSGDDIFQVSTATLNAQDRFDGLAGADTLEMTAPGLLDLTRLASFSGIERISGSSGNDTLVLNATLLSGIGSINGFSGVDVLRLTGGGIFDFSSRTLDSIARIEGSAANDTIIGSNAADTILGGGGNDSLNGERGNDILEGGEGDDTFIFALSNGGIDTIRDFAAGGPEDKINLTGTSGYSSFAQIMGAARQVGSDVVFTFGYGNTLTLANVTLTQLRSSDFLYNGSAVSDGNQGVTQSAIGVQNVDGLLSGYRWAIPSLTYTFTQDSSQYGSGTSEAQDGFRPVTAPLRDSMVSALNAVSAFSGMSFVGVDNDASANIRIAMSNEPSTAWAYYPGNNADSGDIWFGTSRSWFDMPVRGGYAWFAGIHELGHALGLRHPHESGNYIYTSMNPAFDSMVYTAMSYRSYVGATTSGSYTNEEFGYASTFMMYDIAALQAMYGANFATHSGDTVYSWNAVTGEMSLNGVGQGAPGSNRVFMTLWDGNGNDTYDFSNFGSGVTVSLSPGDFSITSEVQRANLGNNNLSPGNVFNSLLFQGDTRSLIENAIGGAGNDTIVGNSAANALTGGAGNDSLTGDAGNDTFVYASGADVITDFVVAGTDDVINLVGLGNFTYIGEILALGAQMGANTVFTFSAGNTLALNNVTLSALTSADFLSDGAGLINVINGTAAGETLIGTIGIDQINGFANNDVIDGRGGGDIISGGDNDDIITYYASDTFTNITGSNGTDTLLITGGSAPVHLNLVVQSFEQVHHEQSDTGGTVAWNTISDIYNADWQVLFSNRVNDDGTRSYSSYDRASTAWNFIVEEFNSSNARTVQQTYYDDSSRNAYYWDFNASQVWRETSEDWNGTNQRTRQNIYYDDTSYRYFFWDPTGAQTWTTFDEQFTAVGNIRFVQRVQNDDGTSSQQFWDTDNSQTYSTYVDYNNSAGQRVEQRIFHDQGSNIGGYTRVFYDPTNAFAWSTQTDVYNAAGIFISSTQVPG